MMLIFAASLAIFVYGMVASMLGTINPGLASKFNLTPEFAVQTFVTQAMYNPFAVANKTRLDVIFSYDFLKTLQRAGLLTQPAGK